jgi:hypothetical protein
LFANRKQPLSPVKMIATAITDRSWNRDGIIDNHMWGCWIPPDMTVRIKTIGSSANCVSDCSNPKPFETRDRDAYGRSILFMRLSLSLYTEYSLAHSLYAEALHRTYILFISLRRGSCSDSPKGLVFREFVPKTEILTFSPEFGTWLPILRFNPTAANTLCLTIDPFRTL